MANQILNRQFQKALSQWPKDVLRPHANFAEMMQKRMQSRPPTEAETNALFSLLEDRYAKKYVLSESTWKPASNPQYYENLIHEMREAPSRSWLQRWLNSWKGFIRWK